MPLKPEEADVSKSEAFNQTCFSDAPVVDEAIPHSVNSDGGAIVGAGVSTQDVQSPTNATARDKTCRCRPHTTNIRAS